MSYDKRLMSIGEVAKALNITRRIILNYEDKGLVFPDKKEGAGKNRYYSPDSISLIRSIRVMQNLGLSLDEIYTYYHKNADLEPLIKRLETLRDEINLNIEKLKERSGAYSSKAFEFTTLATQTVFFRKIRSVSIEERKEILRDVFMEAIRQYGSDEHRRMFFIEYSINSPEEFVCYISIPPESRGENVIQLPVRKALCSFYHGSYESLPEERRRLIAYVKKNNIKFTGTIRHTYLEGPPQHTNPDNFITQVALIIED